MHIKQKYLHLKGDYVLFSRIEKMRTLQLLVFFKHTVQVMKGIPFAAMAYPFIIWKRI